MSPTARTRRGTGESGASLVEYAFLVALIAIVCLAAVQFFGRSIDDGLSTSGSAVTGSAD